MQEECLELSRNMDEVIKIGIIDYLNLVFGAGNETRDYWSNLVLPYTSQYYSFPMDELLNYQTNLNALYFAFIYLFGLKIVKP